MAECKWPNMTKFLDHQWTNPNCFLQWTRKGTANPKKKDICISDTVHAMCSVRCMLRNTGYDKAANYIHIISSNKDLCVNFISKYVWFSVSLNSAELIVTGKRTECRDKNGEQVFEQEAKLGQGLWRGPGSERKSPVRVAEDDSSLFHLCHLINFLWQVLNKAI